MADALDTIEGVLHMGYERVGDEIRDKDNVYLDAADCRVLAAAFAEMAAELDADHGAAAALAAEVARLRTLAEAAAAVLETRDRWRQHVEDGERTRDPLVWAEHVAAMERMRAALKDEGGAEAMKTTKEEREYLRAKYSRAKDYDDDVRRDVLYLLDDADEADAMRAVLAEWDDASVAMDRGDPLGPERLRAAHSAVSALAIKCAEEVGRG